MQISRVERKTVTTQPTTPSAQTEKTTLAFIISLIAGILIITGGLPLLLQLQIAANFGATAGATNYAIMIAAAFICGIMVIIGAILIRTPQKQTQGGILVLTFSLVSILGLGGFIAGLILGTIGGALGLAGPKRATLGFAFSAVAGILSFIWGMGAIDRATHPSYGWGSIVDFRPTAPVWLARVNLGTLGAIEVLCAIMLIIGAVLIFMTGKEKIGAIIVIAFSVIGFISLGSTAAFNILGIIGGALGFAKK